MTWCKGKAMMNASSITNQSKCWISWRSTMDGLSTSIVAQTLRTRAITISSSSRLKCATRRRSWWFRRRCSVQARRKEGSRLHCSHWTKCWALQTSYGVRFVKRLRIWWTGIEICVEPWTGQYSRRRITICRSIAATWRINSDWTKCKMVSPKQKCLTAQWNGSRSHQSRMLMEARKASECRCRSRVTECIMAVEEGTKTST